MRPLATTFKKCSGLADGHGAGGAPEETDQAPFNLHKHMVDLVNAEAERSRAGGQGRIIAKNELPGGAGTDQRSIALPRRGWLSI